jgi:hypothetical protein
VQSKVKAAYHSYSIGFQSKFNCRTITFWTFIWNLCKKQAPKKGEPPISLHVADAVNIVDVGENKYADRLKELVLDQGIDFFMNHSHVH